MSRLLVLWPLKYKKFDISCLEKKSEENGFLVKHATTFATFVASFYHDCFARTKCVI
jgi:hypothetical protein